ncbi:MAG: glycosyltransferase family 4 protein [Gemmatimonadota bacterium]
MRVLHVTLSAAHGGRRDAILTLTEHLRRQGVECGLLALRNLPSDMADVVGQVDYFEGLEIAGRPTLRELAEVRRVCRARGVDLIHAHDGGSQYVASALRLVSPSLRAVMTFHRTLGLESVGLRNRLRNAVTLPMIHKVLTATEERRSYFLNHCPISPEKVDVIPLGIDMATFHPDTTARDALRAELGLRPDTVLALAVGHCGPEKGIDRVVDAFAAARTRLGDTPWHLALLGGGAPTHLEELHRRAREQLGDRVTTAGFRTDVARWLQAADLLVHAPRLEAYGLVLIQAMASGLPVVATAVGGIPEVVEDGTTGTLVANGNDDGLTRAIVSMVEDAALRSRYGNAGLARARERFSAELCADRHRALYQHLIDHRPDGAGVTA